MWSFNVEKSLQMCHIPVLLQVAPYCDIMNCVTGALRRRKGWRWTWLFIKTPEGSLKPQFWAYEVFSWWNVSLYGTFVRTCLILTWLTQYAQHCHGAGKGMVPIFRCNSWKISWVGWVKTNPTANVQFREWFRQSGRPDVTIRDTFSPKKKASYNSKERFMKV